MANLIEKMKTSGLDRPLSGRQQFLEEILSQHAQEIKEQQELEEILKILPPLDKGFHLKIQLVSNRS